MHSVCSGVDSKRNSMQVDETGKEVGYILPESPTDFNGDRWTQCVEEFLRFVIYVQHPRPVVPQNLEVCADLVCNLEDFEFVIECPATTVVKIDVDYAPDDLLGLDVETEYGAHYSIVNEIARTRK